MANRTKLTVEKKQKFLEVVSETANVSRACEAIAMSRVRLYEVRKEDEAFKEQWDAAVEIGIAALEDEATRRAVEGWDEPVFYQGEQTGLVRKYSDTLLMFRMKAQWPEKYRDRVTTELTGKGGGPIESEVKHGCSEAALQRVGDLLTRAATIGTNSQSALSDPNGSILPAAIRAGAGGHGTPVAPGENPGSPE